MRTNFVALHQALGNVPQRPERHHRLVYAGVDPDARGHGLGRLLLHHRLGQLDAQQVHAYAVAVDTTSVRWLACHGFAAHGPPILLPAHGARSAADRREPPAQAGLTLQPMWREPSKRRRHP
jgi:GNAT superfamily N-acetyltransferase